jgi:hypothetical protein
LTVVLTLIVLKIGIFQLNPTVGNSAVDRQRLVAGYEQTVVLSAWAGALPSHNGFG